jgi:hypothetical protein
MNNCSMMVHCYPPSLHTVPFFLKQQMAGIFSRPVTTNLPELKITFHIQNHRPLPFRFWPAGRCYYYHIAAPATLVLPSSTGIRHTVECYQTYYCFREAHTATTSNNNIMLLRRDIRAL